MKIPLPLATGLAIVKLSKAPDEGAVQLYVNDDDDALVVNTTVGFAQVVV